MSERNYINPRVVVATAETLKNWREANKASKTPMLDAMRDMKQPETERARFVRAAQRLGWNVTKSRGHIYENGYFCW